MTEQDLVDAFEKALRGADNGAAFLLLCEIERVPDPTAPADAPRQILGGLYPRPLTDTDPDAVDPQKVREAHGDRPRYLIVELPIADALWTAMQITHTKKRIDAVLKILTDPALLREMANGMAALEVRLVENEWQKTPLLVSALDVFDVYAIKSGLLGGDVAASVEGLTLDEFKPGKDGAEDELLRTTLFTGSLHVPYYLDMEPETSYLSTHVDKEHYKTLNSTKIPAMDMMALIELPIAHGNAFPNTFGDGTKYEYTGVDMENDTSDEEA